MGLFCLTIIDNSQNNEDENKTEHQNRTKIGVSNPDKPVTLVFLSVR